MKIISAKRLISAVLVAAITQCLASCDSGPEQMQGFINHFAKLEAERQKSVQQGGPLNTFSTNEKFHIADVAWCGNNETLVSSGGTDTAVLIWDTRRAEVVRILNRSSGTRAIACSSNGRFIASGNKDKRSMVAVRIWDVSKSDEKSDIYDSFPSLEGNTDSYAKFVAFSSDNSLLFVHYVNRKRINRLVTYEVPSLKVINDFVLPAGRLNAKPIINTHSQLYAYGEGFRNVVVIGAIDGRERLRLSTKKLIPSVLAFGKNNKTIFVGGRRIYEGPRHGLPEQVIEEYRLQDGKLLRSIITGHIDALSAISFLEESDMIITASVDKTVELRSSDSGILLATLGDKINNIYSISIRPDGKQLVSAGGVINIWSLPTARTEPNKSLNLK